jgi:hypothetical protein
MVAFLASDSCAGVIHTLLPPSTASFRKEERRRIKAGGEEGRPAFGRGGRR